MNYAVLLSVLVLISCVHSQMRNVAGESESPVEWIRLSDNVANRYAREIAEFTPEAATEMGLVEFDDKVTPVENNLDTKMNELNLKWVRILSEEENKSGYPTETKEDMRIFKDYVQDQVTAYELDRKYAVLTFNPFSKKVFDSIQTLANPLMGASRIAKAGDRFKAYVNGSGSLKPTAVASVEYYESHRKQYQGRQIIYPSAREIEIYLRESAEYVKGVKEALIKAKAQGWETDYAKFKEQVAVYDAWLRKEVLPKANKEDRLPREIYALRLRTMGMPVSPEELIRLGQTGYKDLFVNFQAQAKIVATKNHLKTSEPAEVIKLFKRKQIVKHDEVERLYNATADRLTQIMKSQNMVTLPARPLAIRLAGEAESMSLPIPHMAPPPMVGNKGERPEFVLPTGKDKMPFDDFSHAFIAIGVTAHEGRPGHDLQFSRMLETGVSTIRGTYAMNSTNVEGWALYAEDLVYPYVSEEEKLFLLQMRLWRMARAFLDPQIQLGQINGQRVIDLYTKELGISKEVAEIELRRYTFMLPGQAPSYYFGYLMLKKARTEAENAAGSGFSLKCFNDQILGYGALPLPMILEKVKADTSCAKAASATATQK